MHNSNDGELNKVNLRILLERTDKVRRVIQTNQRNSDRIRSPSWREGCIADPLWVQCPNRPNSSSIQ